MTIELGTNILLGAAPERIAEIPALLKPTAAAPADPAWDGHAGERAARRAFRRWVDAAPLAALAN